MRSNPNIASYGYVMLNILLGVMLLSGIIYLIMHTMTKYHAEESARAIGSELAPIVSELLITDLSTFSEDKSYALVTPNQAGCDINDGILSNISTYYLESLTASGFNLTDSACVTILR